MLIDILHYRPKLLVDVKTVVPPELAFHVPPKSEMAKDMKIAKDALKKPIHLPPKARFSKGAAIHV